MTTHSPPPRFWLICFLLIVCCCLGQGVAYAQELENAADDDEPEEVRVIDADDDDTADIDTESSVDYDDYDRGLNLSGDFVRSLIISTKNVEMVRLPATLHLGLGYA